MLQYLLLRACNRALSLLYTYTVKNKPVAWHKSIFGHYMIMLPRDVSLIGDDALIRGILRKLSYFKMASVHEDIFMASFMEFLMGERKGLFTRLYVIHTNLTTYEVDQRVKSIELIFNSYDGIDRLHHLTSFFLLDHSLPEGTIEEIKGSIFRCFAYLKSSTC